MNMANDFVENVVTFSCKLARHRGADTLEARDVMLHLGEQCCRVFAALDDRPLRAALSTPLPPCV